MSKHQENEDNSYEQRPENQEPSAQPQEKEPFDQKQLIEQLKSEKDELHSQLLRALADLQNYRKRAIAEKEEIRKYATEHLVKEIIPVLDNFERTLAAIDAGASMESLVEGIKMVERQLRGVLSNVQLSKIAASGTIFDPTHHEAIAAEYTEEHPEDTVIHVLEPGYTMAGRVIRPAKVKVAKKKP